MMLKKFQRNFYKNKIVTNLQKFTKFSEKYVKLTLLTFKENKFKMHSYKSKTIEPVKEPVENTAGSFLSG